MQEETLTKQTEQAPGETEWTTSYSTVIPDRKADSKALVLVLPSERKRHLLRKVALEWEGGVVRTESPTPSPKAEKQTFTRTQNQSQP